MPSRKWPRGCAQPCCAPEPGAGGLPWLGEGCRAGAGGWDGDRQAAMQLRRGPAAHTCPPGHSQRHSPPTSTAFRTPPILPKHLSAQAEVGMRHISVNHHPTPPPHRPEPALLPPAALPPPGGSRPPASKGLRGPRASGRQWLEQTRAGEVLAAGSEPGEAAKPSSAKRVGVSPRQQPGRGPATGLDMADGSPSHRPVTPPRSGLPGDTSGAGGGGQRNVDMVGVPGQSPTSQG